MRIVKDWEQTFDQQEHPQRAVVFFDVAGDVEEIVDAPELEEKWDEPVPQVMETCWLCPHFLHECNSEHTVDRATGVPTQVVSKLTEADKTFPEELLSERIVEIAVDGLWPHAATQPVARNLPS